MKTISNCEREFLLALICDNKRIDGRLPTEIREVKIAFGCTYGSCTASMGQTRVFSQVSCEVKAPKDRRPNEGVLFVNLEMSPMAHPTFEQGRQSDDAIQINRLLERCLKESSMVDLESLCIVSGEKAWTIRVDITVLNHAGNILDTASISAVAALAHFRRPDVSVKGEEITIHTPAEKDPIPLSIHHMPICCSFAFFHQGKNMLLDSSEREERVAEGRMVIGLNSHREICMLQITGQMMLQKEKVQQCTKIAYVKVLEITQLIHKALANDKEARARGERSGFAVAVHKVEALNTTATAATPISAPPTPPPPSDSDSDDMGEDEEEGLMDGSGDDSPKAVGKGVAIMGYPAIRKWTEEEQREKKRVAAKKRKS